MANYLWLSGNVVAGSLGRSRGTDAWGSQRKGPRDTETLRVDTQGKMERQTLECSDRAAEGCLEVGRECGDHNSG